MPFEQLTVVRCMRVVLIVTANEEPNDERTEELEDPVETTDETDGDAEHDEKVRACLVSEGACDGTTLVIEEMK